MVLPETHYVVEQYVIAIVHYVTGGEASCFDCTAPSAEATLNCADVEASVLSVHALRYHGTNLARDPLEIGKQYFCGNRLA
jgi:hypothetical protein